MRMKALVGFPPLVLMLFVAASAQQPAPTKAPAKPQVVAAIAQTKETQAAITPQMALQMLKDGNERFVSGTMKKRDLAKQVKATSTGQFPFATVVSCMDSRAAPELIFDQGIGDLFSPRIAGNFVNDDIIGSLEYGSGVVGARLIVVLGHSDCGAVKGACDKREARRSPSRHAGQHQACDRRGAQRTTARRATARTTRSCSAWPT